MKLSKVVYGSVLFALLCVQVQEVNSDAGMILLALVGGFFLGNLALSAFMVLLMAIVPPDAARSLTSSNPFHHRTTRSIFNSSDYEQQHKNNIQHSLNKLSEIAKITNTSYNTEESARDSRFLTGLLKSDPLNCMPQVMCELIRADEPTSKTDTLNDYKYLMKELLKSDDDEDDKDDQDKIQLRNDKNSKNKSKGQKKKAGTKNGDSSQEDSQSKSSEEKKRDGLAEIMELEEEDALEDKAFTDLVNEDPGDIGYAIADMKRKERIKEKVANGEYGTIESDEYALQDGSLGGTLSYRRNLKLLERSLEENSNQRVFRTSRAFKDNFLQRKTRELEQTKDIFDRVRIAAEVKGVTRSGRKCRALFNTCPLGGQGIAKMVNSIRKAIIGVPIKTPNQKKTTKISNKSGAISMADLQTIIQTIQQSGPLNVAPAPVSGGTDVKVVLNIGGAPPMQAYVPNVQPMPNPTPKPNPAYLDYSEHFLKPTAQSVKSAQYNKPPSNTPIPFVMKTSTMSPLPLIVRTSTKPTYPIEIKPPSSTKATATSTTHPAPTSTTITNVTVTTPSKKIKTKTSNTPAVRNPMTDDEFKKYEAVFPSTPLYTSPPPPTTHTSTNNGKQKQKPSKKSGYKIQLKKAVVLLNKMPPSPSSPSKSKTTNVPPTQKPLIGLSRVQEKLEEIIKVIDPKLANPNTRLTKDSDESDSESSEELEDILNAAGVIPRQSPSLSQSNIQTDFQTEAQQQVHHTHQPLPQYTQNYKEQNPSPLTHPHRANPNSQRNRPNSFMGNVYEMFFRDKQTAPLPSDPMQYIPSAQRHAYSQNSRFAPAPILPTLGGHSFQRPPSPSDPDLSLSFEDSSEENKPKKKKSDKSKSTKSPGKNRRRPPVPNNQFRSSLPKYKVNGSNKIKLRGSG